MKIVDSNYEYYLPKMTNGELSLLDSDGINVIGDMVKFNLRDSIVSDSIVNNQALRFDPQSQRWRRVSSKLYFNSQTSRPVNELKQPIVEEVGMEHDEVVKFVHSESIAMKPPMLYMDDLIWKYLVRSVIRSQNVLMTGPTGSGKTVTVKWLAEALNRPLFIYNLGSTQDPRSSLIGNTHFSNESGTFFSQSEFIRAIQTPNSVILLDEVSRANPEAFNILMTVLDKHQRYVRIDEDVNSPVIKVHPTVTFIGTANVGIEYSSTRVIDRALLDRFVTVNMKYLDEYSEASLLSKLFPSVNGRLVQKVATLVSLIREDAMSEDSNLTNSLSTRHSIEMVSLINDGFNLKEIADLVIYPQFSEDGGLESERTFVKQLIQSKFTDDGEGVIPDEFKNANNRDDLKKLFNTTVF